MKKYILITALLIAVVAAVGFAGYAYAQRSVPNSPGLLGHMGGMHGSGFQFNGTRGSGLLHNYMVNSFAKALNLSPAELDSRLQNGEAMWQIAETQGIATEDFANLMVTIRTEAIGQAVADGVISQEQADWMEQRMQSMQQRGFGAGDCSMYGAGTTEFSGRGPWNRQP